MPEKRRKAKIFEKWYGQPYVPKTFVEIKRCRKCGKEMPIDSVAKTCPYCGGMLTKQYVKREQGGKSVAVSREF